MHEGHDRQGEDAADEPGDTAGPGGDAAPEEAEAAQTPSDSDAARPEPPETEAAPAAGEEAGETSGTERETAPGDAETDRLEPPDTAGDPEPDTGPEAPAAPSPEPDPATLPEADAAPEPEADAAPSPEPEPAAPPDPEPAPGPDIPAAAGTDEPCAAGLFGKMPARGDFISRAIEREVLRPLEEWLLQLVQQTRDLLGGDWERAWRQAPPWRFWIGPDILRGDWTRSSRGHDRAGVVTGVILPSADRQGRLFPLVLVLADEHARLMPPPVLAPPDRGWYAACDRLLHAAREGRALETVEADLAALRAPRLPGEAGQMAPLLVQRALWGQGAGRAAPGDADDVWSGIRASDHHLAASGRSYWWCEAAGGATSVISLAGLPDAETFAFMLTDAIPADGPQTGA